MAENPTSTTYRDAGVDIEAGDALVDRIKPAVKRSMRREVLGGIGGFGALVEVPLDRYRKPVMVSGTDGVGTKLRLAIETGRHDTIGIDLVGDVRQRRRRAGCRTDVLPRLLRDRQARRRHGRARHQGHRRGLPAGGLRARRRRDRRDARHVRRRGLRPRGLLRRPRREGPDHRRHADARWRRDHRPRFLGRPFQRLFADPTPARIEWRWSVDAARRPATLRPAARADPHLRQVRAGTAQAVGAGAQPRAHHGWRPDRQHSARACPQASKPSSTHGSGRDRSSSTGCSASATSRATRCTAPSTAVSA